MPIRDFKIPETNTHILDPVVQQVGYALLNDLGLRGYFGDDVYFLTDTQGATNTFSDNHTLNTLNDRCNFVYESALNPNEMKWDVMSFRHTQAYGTLGIHRNSMTAIFHDTVADVSIQEHQVPCTITMEVTLMFQSKEMAANTITAIVSKHHQGTVVKAHDLYFDYPLSTDLIYSLYSVYKLKYPDKSVPFVDYLKTQSNGAIAYLHNPNLDHIELVVKRAQLSSLGVMEYSQNKPEAEQVAQVANRFHVTFMYTIQFARPDKLTFYAPVVVNNQLIPERLIPAGESTFYPALTGVYPDIPVTLTLQEYYKYSKHVIRFPDYDDFNPARCPAVTYKFQHFLVLGFLLDKTPITRINLPMDIYPLKFHPTAQEIMRSHGRDIFGTSGLFNITVFANDVQVEPGLVTIDDNLVVEVAMASIEKRYHLVLSEATDLNNVDPKYWDLLTKYPDFFGLQILKNLRYLKNVGVDIDDAFAKTATLRVPLRVMNADLIVPDDATTA